MIVVLDAGHGGRQPGAVANGLVEKDITFDIVQWAKAYLIASPYFKVNLTRDGDKDVSLADRCKVPGDIFVSVHCNAGGGQGLETWHQQASVHAEKSKKLALLVHSSVLAYSGFSNRGLKTKVVNGKDALFVLHWNKRPSILIEVGFIDNPDDAKKLADPNFRRQVARAIAQGIEAYATSQA